MNSVVALRRRWRARSPVDSLAPIPATSGNSTTARVGRKPGGKRRFRKAKRPPPLGRWSAAVIVVLLGVYVLMVFNSRPHVSGDRLRLDTFVNLAADGRIKDARILDQDAYAVGRYTRDDGSVGRYSVAYLTESRERLVQVLLDNNVSTVVQQQPAKRLLGPATAILPALIVVVVFVYLILSFQRGTGLFGLKSGARRVDADGRLATFADVAGQDAALTELKEIKEFLADPGRFAALGAAVPKGILLYGPPGSGKTLLARAVAGEAGAAFYSISGSDFVEMYVGVGAARVRELFREAREHAPAIVFIDELDAVGRRRTSGGHGSHGGQNEQEQALNQVLTEMDGFSPMEGIIVMAATNRPDVLDPALLRPGRFDRTVGLERPDEKGRLAVLEVHAREKPMEPGADLAAIAKRAIGLSGADLANVVNEAALLAARAGHPAVTQIELDEALVRILEAPERQRRLSQRDRSFGRSTGAEARVGFADVAGVDEAIAELGEVRDYLAEPERFTALGARAPRGFLLVGPPGCGKTLLARAVASEANAAFFSVAATEFVEVFSGEGAARVRDLFAEARAAAPAVVFIDEIDAVGTRRGAGLGGQRETEQTLNQILVELDGFDPRAAVTVLAASNRPEILDEALVRPGRFDRTVVIGLPDLRSRRAVLGIHARDKRLADDVDLDGVARMTQGFSGADLANVLNEAALLAGRRRLVTIPAAAVAEAVQRVGVGIARAGVLSPAEAEMVAYHEAGHALVGMALPGAQTPQQVSIVARGHALGVTWSASAADRSVYPRSMLCDELAVLLGGRAAEELVFGEPGSGAADDLKRADEMARRMVCELGMGLGLGQRVYLDATGTGRRPGWSEAEAEAVGAEVSRLLDEAYARARSVLSDSRDALDRASRALVERETLTGAELEQLLGRPATSVSSSGTRGRPRTRSR